MPLRRTPPFLHSFLAVGRRWIYDVVTDGILEVDEVIWAVAPVWGTLRDAELIDRFAEQFGRERVRQRVRQLHAATRRGLFSSHRPSALHRPWSQPEAEHAVAHGQRHVLLEITQQCNLRCDYCVYSGAYPCQRTHQPVTMPAAVARAAVDLLADHCDEVAEPAVGFYGGEPLLALLRIRQAADQARRRLGERLRLSLTTNATLLDDEAGDWLATQGVFTLVSLDGPRHLHDRARRFREGAGSFERVMANLTRLRERHPAWYERCISFNAVVPDARDLEEIRTFFTECAATRGQDLDVSGLHPHGRVGSPEVGQPGDREVVAGIEAAWEALVLERIRSSSASAAAGLPLPPVQKMFEHDLVRLQARPTGVRLGRRAPCNGVCLPGIRKLFVRADGALCPCERVPPGLTVGHVRTGLDVRRMLAIVEEHARRSRDACVQCWAVRHCTLCYVAAWGAGFDAAQKARACEGERRRLDQALVRYVSVLERHPEIREYLAARGRATARA